MKTRNLMGLLCAVGFLYGCTADQEAKVAQPMRIAALCDITTSVDSHSVEVVARHCRKLIMEAPPGSTIRFTLLESNCHLEPLHTLSKSPHGELSSKKKEEKEMAKMANQSNTLSIKLRKRYEELAQIKDKKQRRTCIFNCMLESASWLKQVEEGQKTSIYVFSDMAEECEHGPFGSIFIQPGKTQKALKMIQRSEIQEQTLASVDAIHLIVTNEDVTDRINQRDLRQIWQLALKKLGYGDEVELLGTMPDLK